MGAGPAISLVRELSHQDISVAGLIITGALPSLVKLLSEYRIFWLPVKRFPRPTRLLTGGMCNKWPNKDRLVEIVRRSPCYHIEIFHSEEEFENEKNTKKIEMGKGGWSVEWPTTKGFVRQEVTRYGVHDKIMAHPQVALATYRAFQSTDSGFTL